MKSGWRISVFVGVLSLLAANTSCTPEKAKALQTAATNFSSESEAATRTLQELFVTDVGASVESDQNELEETFRTLQHEKSISADTLSELLTGSSFSAPALDESNKEFGALQAQYAQFAAMYQSLERGYLFAGDSVKQSESVAIKLTVQLINFAQIVKRTPFQFRSRRVLLIEKINRAYQLSEEEARNEALRSAAQDVVQLRKDEVVANDNSIRQCLKAAEAGRVTTNLIRDYKKMSIADMLSTVNDSLTFIGDISKEPNVTNALKKYAAIEATIRTDPYWSPMLTQPSTLESDHAAR